MKKILFVFIVAIFSLTSCNQTRRIVTDTPIKTNILGIEIGKTMSSGKIQDVLINNTDTYFLPLPKKNGNAEVYRYIPVLLNFNYGGLTWTYIDVGTTNDSKVYAVSLVGSYESMESAKQQYDSAVAIFTKKYGKGNVNESDSNGSNIYWTDDVNSVRLICYKSSAVNGSDRCFCELYYINNALSDKVDAENQPDI